MEYRSNNSQLWKAIIFDTCTLRFSVLDFPVRQTDTSWLTSSLDQATEWLKIFYKLYKEYLKQRRPNCAVAYTSAEIKRDISINWVQQIENELESGEAKFH